MNKKLGAFALLGASAVVLAGCAAGDTGGNDASGTPAPAQLRVWLSAPTRRRMPATIS
jgi:N,N'-diacetylchitobiose transport system substrate-binding protein